MKNESEIIEFIIESSDDEEKEDMTDSELVVYNDNPEKKDYFVGHKIASLLGYINKKDAISKNVKDENKISFKDYNGKKEPKLNSNVILITRDGIDDLLSKKKELTSEALDILSKINVDVSMFADESDIEEDEIDEEEGELTMYSYINNGYCFEYFVGYEITALLGYKNTNAALTSISKSNKIEFRDYPGVKKPKQDPKTILITRDGAIEILIKTRKRLSADVLHILKTFNIDTTNRKCLTKEQQTLSSIVNVFKTEKYEDQYKIGKYFLDLFFSEYKIVIECDENGHADRKPWKERERMDYVNKTLEITDDNWIRFNPDEFDFDLSRVTGQIYRKIDEIKEEENKRKEEEYRKLLEENSKKPLKKSEKRVMIPNIVNEISTCTMCNTDFKSENNLKIHMKKVHNIGDKINKKCISVMINNKNYDINIDSDNMINASLLCKETGKNFYDYRTLRQVRYEIGRISKKFKIPDSILMISVRNIAWIHIHLLPHFSNWLSEYIGEQVKEVFDTLKIIETLPEYVPDKVFNLTLVNGQNLEITLKNNNYININNICRSSGKNLCDWKKRNLDLLKKYKNPMLEYSSGLFAHPNLAIMIAEWCDKKYTEQFLEILKDNPLFNLEMYNGKQSVEICENEDEFIIETSDMEQLDDVNDENEDKFILETLDTEPYDVIIEDEDSGSVKTKEDLDPCKTCKKWKTCEECKTCKICNKKFATKPKVKRHFESVHQKLKYKCDLCQTELSSKESLKTHINTVHEKKNVVKCDICEREYVNNSSLQLHIKSVHEKITNESSKIFGKICATK